MTYVSRDPFAREELHRQRVYPLREETCAWCGQVKTAAHGKPFLFSYWIETDGGRHMPIRGLFCSVECMRTYAR